ncbi:MAG: DHA2 family efflux MFS transporter permease subunit [Alcanivorax sp.]|uniref:DHA2 family efflux MFS transporter permease subunit n=1 Tax=unclassified Alcanivorax TaxID=2638842 RepID=UPI000789D2DF|nr:MULTISPECIES: DHA2 family efflux MFS transporter permease subunit [unclassified Alcanivorax]MDF1724377.1 DHA2 family efflux MFS transporter permease subunit [Alcanivorax sp.]
MASVEAQVERLFDRYGPRYRWLATITVMLGTMSVVLASTIINVAIPTIMVEFRLAQDQVHWLATGFLAAMTVGMLLNAWCAQRFGARGAYLLAMGLFIVVSIIGAVSEQFPLLVAARIGQGLLAGLVQPLAMITIFQVFPLNRRGQAMGIYGLGVVLGPAIAPAIGGVLVDTLSWRAVFLVVLPACVVGMVMAWRYLPGKDRQLAPVRLDRAGVLLLALGITAVLWGLANGHRRGWSDPWLLTTLLVGTVSLAWFVVWQRRHAHPLMDLRVFAYPGFTGSFLMSMVIGAGVFASTYVTPLYFQQVLGESAASAGLMLMPAGLAMAFTFPVAGHLTDRFSETRIMIIGLLLFVLNMALMAGATLATSAVWLVWWTLLGRVGLGLMMPPSSTGALGLLPPALIPQGSGIFNFARQIGGALGVNLCALCIQFFSDRYGQTDPGLSLAEAFEFGFDRAFWLLLIVFLLSLWPLHAMRQGLIKRHCYDG